MFSNCKLKSWWPSQIAGYHIVNIKVASVAIICLSCLEILYNIPDEKKLQFFIYLVMLQVFKNIFVNVKK